MLVHYSSDTLDAVVEDVLLGVPSFLFAFPQMGLVQLETDSISKTPSPATFAP